MPALNGKNWFRNNISPYLTAIKNSVGGYSPIIDIVDPLTFASGNSINVNVKGQFFTPDTLITTSTATISNVVFISTHEMTFDIISAVDLTHTITVTNPTGSSTFIIDSVTSLWVDLRLGSGSTFTELHRTGTTITRDASGISSSGSLWSNWFKFDSHSWNRSNLKRVSIIVNNTPGTAFMAGIMSEEQVETDNSQYYQAEIYAYTPANYLWGFYGTNASHAGVNNSQTGGSTLTGTISKIVFENNGQGGANFFYYELPNLSNFDDITNLKESGTIGTNMDADGNTLMVSITTGNVSTKVIAFLVEDM